MRVRQSDEGPGMLKEPLFVSESMRLMKKLFGCGREIQEIADQPMALISPVGVDLRLLK